ncbi:MAG: response regulator [Verrucomicrobiota bacterium]
MNIIFLEDEVELSAIGVEQLRKLGHTVHPALNLADARELVDENWQTIHLIIADHRLPDGAGIDYLMEVKERYPRIKLAVVSGCLTPVDEEMLDEAGIPYFTKPLLYRQVIQKLRQHYMMHTRPPVPPRATMPPSPLPAAHKSIGAPPPQVPKPPPVKEENVLAGASVEVENPPKKRGLTSVIFSKLTGKND